MRRNTRGSARETRVHRHHTGPRAAVPRRDRRHSAEDVDEYDGVASDDDGSFGVQNYEPGAHDPEVFEEVFGGVHDVEMGDGGFGEMDGLGGAAAADVAGGALDPLDAPFSDDDVDIVLPEGAGDGGEVELGGRFALRADCVNLSADASYWRPLAWSSVSGAATALRDRAADMTVTVVARLKAGHVSVPDAWSETCRTRPRIYRRIVGILFACWDDYSRRTYSGKWNARGVARVIFLLHPFTPAPVDSAAFDRETARLSYLSGLAPQELLHRISMPLVGGQKITSAEEDTVSGAVLDPVAAAVASMLTFESIESLEHMAGGPYIALPLDRTVAHPPSSADVAHLARTLNQGALRLFRTTESLAGYGDGDIAAVDLDECHDPLAAGVRSAELAADHPRGFDPATAIARIPITQLPPAFWRGDTKNRTVIVCTDEDPLWVMVRDFFTENGDLATLERIRRGGVTFEGLTYVFRVFQTFEDSIEASHAFLNGGIRFPQGAKPILFPVALSRDGVASSMAIARSVIPMMVAGMCGATSKWWSSRLVAILAVGSCLSPGKAGSVSDLNARRLHHMEEREVITRIAHVLHSALFGEPSVVITSTKTDTVYVPLPYVASFVVDQVEEQKMASRMGTWCSVCTSESPLHRWGQVLAVMQSRGGAAAVEDEKDDDGGEEGAEAAERLQVAHERAKAEAIRACAEPTVVRRHVLEWEAQLAECLKRKFNPATHVHLQPVMPLEAFAEATMISDVNVMLREPLSRDGRHPFAGDPMHLLSLAMKHTLALLKGGMQLREQEEFRAAWVSSASHDPRTHGIAGNHVEDQHRLQLEPPDFANETQRYSYFLRAFILAQFASQRHREFVCEVMRPLARVILLFYAPHDRVAGPVLTSLDCATAAWHVAKFRKSFTRWHLDHVGPVDARVELSHENLAHSVSAWLRFGSSVLTSMSPFEKRHQVSRLSVNATSRQTVDSDASIPLKLTIAATRLQTCSALAAEASGIPDRRRRGTRDGGITADMEKLEVIPADVSAWVRLALRCLTDGEVPLFSDDGDDVVLPDEVEIIQLSKSCWIPVHSYCVDTVGFFPNEDVASIPFLFAAKYVAVAGREEPPPDAAAAAPAVVAPRTWSAGPFLFGGAAEVRVRRVSDDGATRMTVLLGRTLDPQPSPSGVDIACFSVPTRGSYNAVCPLWAVGGVHGALWQMAESAEAMTLSTIGVVHPALVAVKRSWLR